MEFSNANSLRYYGHGRRELFLTNLARLNTGPKICKLYLQDSFLHNEIVNSLLRSFEEFQSNNIRELAILIC